MKHNLYYGLDADRNVVPVCHDAAIRIFGMNEYRKVAVTTLPDPNGHSVDVSTVFLVIDHSFGDGEPLVFETVIFGGYHDQHQVRYHTWDEAVVGHEEAVLLAQTAITEGKKGNKDEF